MLFHSIRQDFRVFRLERMQDMTVTDESFLPNRVPLLRDAIARHCAECEVQEHMSES